jgi:hypothetical protein
MLIEPLCAGLCPAMTALNSLLQKFKRKIAETID